VSKKKVPLPKKQSSFKRLQVGDCFKLVHSPYKRLKDVILEKTAEGWRNDTERAANAVIVDSNEPVYIWWGTDVKPEEKGYEVRNS
jgi:hypothetical protein